MNTPKSAPRYELFWNIERYFPSLRVGIWRVFYDLFAWKFSTEQWTFMNYGFQGDKELGSTLALAEADEANRYFIQLYQHLISEIDLADKVVLEVGSGRGGGCEWLARCTAVKAITGMDLSSSAVKLCTKIHQHPKLEYIQGNAQRLPFADNSLDVVINVESCHHYPDFPGFLAEVYRVLKPGGRFALADYRNDDEEQDFINDIKQSKFTLTQQHNVTQNVITAIDIDSERRSSLIGQYVPKLLKPLFSTFAAIKGTPIYNDFKDGSMVYWSFGLIKGEGKGEDKDA